MKLLQAALVAALTLPVSSRAHAENWTTAVETSDG